MYILGDKLTIKYQVLVDQKEEIELEGTVVITYFDGKKLYTCGHCFPKNATLLTRFNHSSGLTLQLKNKRLILLK